MSFTPVSLREERFFDGEVFPLTLQLQTPSAATFDVTSWLTSHRDSIDGLLRKNKAVLFRCGDAVPTYEQFHLFVESLHYQTMDYVGGAAVRTQLTDRVFTANESPSTENIPFHHEMAQTPQPPTHLFFFCETAPNSGGETPILVSAEVCSIMRQRHPDFMSELQQCGVRYVRYMPELDDPTSAIGRGWRSTFQCTNRAGAEAALRALGSSWEWLADGSLKTVTATVPAIRRDDQPPGAERSQQETFYNSIVAAYTGWNDSRNVGSKAVVLGCEADGQGHGGSDCTYLDERAITEAAQVMQDVCVAFPWRAGDVLLLDNRTVMHSRRSFEGPRRILASLARDPVR